MMIEQVWYLGIAYFCIGFYLAMKNVSEIIVESNLEPKENFGLIGFLIVLVTAAWPFVWLLGVYRDWKRRKMEKMLQEMGDMFQ